MHVETLSIAAAPTNGLLQPTLQSISTEQRVDDALQADSNDNPLEYIDPAKWTDYASRMFVECLPPTGTTTPCM
jgi:hypothetical protein